MRHKSLMNNPGNMRSVLKIVHRFVGYCGGAVDSVISDSTQLHKSSFKLLELSTYIFVCNNVESPYRKFTMIVVAQSPFYNHTVLSIEEFSLAVLFLDVSRAKIFSAELQSCKNV